MSKIIDDYNDFHAILKTEKCIFVLFYTSWCPFSKRFLPIFENTTDNKNETFLRICVEDQDLLCTKYNIEVFPTVIFFKNERIADRLNALPGIGLNEKQLKCFIDDCKKNYYESISI